MTREELKLKLSELLPSAVLEEGAEWLTVVVHVSAWKGFAKQLRFNTDLAFDYLFCITCVDWKTHFTMVYHFTSTIHRHTVVLKSTLDHINPEIETVCDI